MSEEKELEELDFDETDALEDFVDFSDLGDFESVSTNELFGKLGDIDDLGDMPELTDEVPVSAAKEAGEEMAADIPLPDMAEETAVPDIPLPDMPEEAAVPDITLPEMTEEAAVPDISLSDMAEEVPVSDMPDFDIALSDTADDMSDFEIPSDTVNDISEFDMSDATLPSGEFLSDLDAGVSFDSVEPVSDVPDIFESNMEPDLFADGESVSEPAAEEDMFSMEDAEASVMDALDVLDASGGVTVSEESGSGSSEEMEFGLPGTGEAMEEMPLAMEESNESGLDSMLGGILGNLDMGGSADETAATDSISMDELDSMDDILGLAGDSFASEDFGENAGSDMSDMLDVAGMIPEEAAAEAENPGLLKKVFGNVITDEIAEAERQAAQKEEEEAAKKAEESAKAKEEAEVKKAEKQAEKEAKKAEKQKAREAKKAEKAERKAEKKAKREEEEASLVEVEVVGRLNKVGVSIIVIATILFLVVEIAGTNVFSYASTKRKASNYFEMGKYTEAYKEAIGTDLREKDEETYNKIKVVMRVQQSLNAYQNYDRINYYPEALDALLRGIKRYDANIEQAMELEVEDDMISCRRQILTLLQEEFNLSETEAYKLLALEEDEYQEQVIALGLKKRL